MESDGMSVSSGETDRHRLRGRAKQICYPNKRPRVDKILYQASVPPVSSILSFSKEKAKALRRRRLPRDSTLFKANCRVSQKRLSSFLKFCDEVSQIGEADADVGYGIIGSRHAQCLHMLKQCSYDTEFAKFRIISTLGGGVQEEAIKNITAQNILYEELEWDEEGLIDSLKSNSFKSASVAIEWFENYSACTVGRAEINQLKSWILQVRIIANDKISRTVPFQNIVELVKYGLKLETFCFHVVSSYRGKGSNGSFVQEIEQQCKSALQSFSLIKKKYKRFLMLVSKAYDIAAYGRIKWFVQESYVIEDIYKIYNQGPANVKIVELVHLLKLKSTWENIEQCFTLLFNKKQVVQLSNLRTAINEAMNEGILLDKVREAEFYIRRHQFYCEEIERVLSPHLYGYVNKRKGGMKDLKRENFLDLSVLNHLKRNIQSTDIASEASECLFNLILRSEQWFSEYELVLSNPNHKIKDLIILKSKADRIPVNLGERMITLQQKIGRAQEWLSKIKFNLKTKGPKSKPTRSNNRRKQKSNFKMDIVSLRALRKEAPHLGLEDIEISNLDELISSVETWLREASYMIVSAEKNVLSFEVNSTREESRDKSKTDCVEPKGNLDGKAIIKELELLRYQADDFPADLSKEFKYIQLECEFYSFWDDILKRISSRKITFSQLKEKIQEIEEMRTDFLPKNCGFLNLGIDSIKDDADGQSLQVDESLSIINGLVKSTPVNLKRWKRTHQDDLEKLLNMVKDIVKSVVDVTSYMTLEVKDWMTLSRAERKQFMQDREKHAHLFELSDLMQLKSDISRIPVNLDTETRDFFYSVDLAQTYKGRFTKIINREIEVTHADTVIEYEETCRLGILFPELLQIRKHLILSRNWHTLYKHVVSSHSTEKASKLVKSFSKFDVKKLEELIMFGRDTLIFKVSKEIVELENIQRHIQKRVIEIKTLQENILLKEYDEVRETHELHVEDISSILRIFPSDDAHNLLLSHLLEGNTQILSSQRIKEPVKWLSDTALDILLNNGSTFLDAVDSIRRGGDFFLIQNLKAFQQVAVTAHVIRLLLLLNEGLVDRSFTLNELLLLLLSLYNFIALVDSHSNSAFLVPIRQNSLLAKDDIQYLSHFSQNTLNLISAFHVESKQYQFSDSTVDMNKNGRASLFPNYIGFASNEKNDQKKVLIDEDLILHSRPKRCIKPAYSVSELKNPLAGYVEVGKTSKSTKADKTQAPKRKIRARKKIEAQGCIEVKVIRNIKASTPSKTFINEPIQWSQEETLQLDTTYPFETNRDNSIIDKNAEALTKNLPKPSSTRAADILDWMKLTANIITKIEPQKENAFLLDKTSYLYSTTLVAMKFLRNELKTIVTWRKAAQKLLKASGGLIVDKDVVTIYRNMVKLRKKLIRINVSLPEETKMNNEIVLIESWVQRVHQQLGLRKNAYTHWQKSTEIQIEKLAQEGARLKGRLVEHELIKNALAKTQEWLDKLKNSGIEAGQAKISFLRQLLLESEELPIDVSKHTVIIEKATKRYCLCKEPQVTQLEQMIKCCGCAELFHRNCVFPSPLEPEKQILLEANFRCIICGSVHRSNVLKGFIQTIYAKAAATLSTIEENDSFDNNQTSRDYHFYRHYTSWLKKSLDYCKKRFGRNLYYPQPEADITLANLKSEAGLFPNLHEARIVLQSIKSLDWINEVTLCMTNQLKAEQKISLNVIHELIAKSKEATSVELQCPVKGQDGNTTTRLQSFISTDTLPGLQWLRGCANRASQWQKEVEGILNCDRSVPTDTVLATCSRLIQEHRYLVIEFHPLLRKLIAVMDDNANRHCICDGFNDGQFMISCEKCEIWFHGKCISMTAKDGKEHDGWKCRRCS